MRVPPDDAPSPAEAIARLKRRIEVAEEECGALRVPGREEAYMQACSTVEALELQLEERLRHAVT